MFKEYWNGYLALGVAVGLSLAFNIVGFLSVGFDWVGLEKATTNTYTYAEQQCRRQQAERAATPSAALPNPEAAPAEPQADQGGGRERGEPDWCDLAAQQSMADSTFGMEQAAWIALGLTIIGVVLVWRTLYYTRETLKEAQAATVAANAAVAVTREIGQAQVRAYLTLEKAHITHVVEADQVAWRIVLTVYNCGQSPARNVRINLTEYLSRISEVDAIGRSIRAGQEADITLIAYTKSDDITFNSIDDNRMSIAFHASISYSDVFAGSLRSEVRYLCVAEVSLGESAPVSIDFIDPPSCDHCQD